MEISLIKPFESNNTNKEYFKFRCINSYEKEYYLFTFELLIKFLDASVRIYIPINTLYIYIQGGHN